ncbi:hypothetical protein FOXG_04392 [Fusarium oxysporum f. sp. lycopersici 4287]|uniref:Uncharacterized protein n=2 Tax=Fusarium oxysporum TaxID=5507 RepID=A0A0J9UP41_FUSO4|nr:hypothetical protein FOXG_04392 [Fusarium oxysporum f. sp. lycopersici 4287]KNB01055.1 hypothetical protein FOXG_04392 [Fusarium oxysporum f. sp. lycopersici 4287]
MEVNFKIPLRIRDQKPKFLWIQRAVACVGFKRVVDVDIETGFLGGAEDGGGCEGCEDARAKGCDDERVEGAEFARRERPFMAQIESFRPVGVLDISDIVAEEVTLICERVE